MRLFGPAKRIYTSCCFRAGSRIAVVVVVTGAVAVGVMLIVVVVVGLVVVVVVAVVVVVVVAVVVVVVVVVVAAAVEVVVVIEVVARPETRQMYFLGPAKRIYTSCSFRSYARSRSWHHGFRL